MKTKIFDALKQEYKSRYGLSDSDWSDIAAIGAISITDEGQIPAFIQGAETIVKKTQSANDTATTLRKQSEQKPIESQTPPPPAQGGDLAALLAEMKADREAREAERAETKALIEGMQGKLNAYEAQKTTEQTIAQAKAEFFKNPATKQYANEGSDAWERAMEIYEVSGKEFSSADLVGKATSYFDKLASRSGYDAATFVPSGGDAKPKSMLDNFIEKEEASKTAQANDQQKLRDYYGLNDGE